MGLRSKPAERGVVLRRILLLALLGATALVLTSSAPASGVPLPSTIAALGDSITTAWGSGLDQTGSAIPDDNVQASWATGSDSRVNSQAARISALGGVQPATLNLAHAGQRVIDDDGVRWQATHVPSGVDYVLIETGSADICAGSVTSPSAMTTVSDVQDAISETLTTLTSNLPGVRILIASIPDWYALWQSESDVTRPASTCPLLFSHDPTIANDASRVAVQQRIDEYNGVFAQVCSQYTACRYDGGAVHAIDLQPEDVSAYDHLHPSVAGQAKIAAATWAASWWGAPSAPINTRPPSLTGQAVAGGQLTGDVGTWTGSPSPAITEQWLQCDPGGLACAPISLATGTTYQISPADKGHTFRFQATATNSAGTATATSDASSSVPNPPTVPPTATTLPSIAGVAQTGQTLNGTNAVWSGDPYFFEAQWQRCSPTGANCADIAGATAAVYTLRQADLGGTVVLRMTAYNVAGKASSVSQPTAVVVAPTNVLAIDQVFANPNYFTLAVDHNGVAYGSSASTSDPRYRLYRSFDEGRSWTQLVDFPSNVTLTSAMAVLTDNTLLIQAEVDGVMHLFRSGDGGVSWTDVFQFFGDYQILTGDSITDDGTYVYVGSYNVLDFQAHTNWIWRSADDGRTWSVVRTTTTYRHVHFVQRDPATNAIYAGYGDTQGAIERSNDHGLTWQTVCSGPSCVAVDLAFDASGHAIFGSDEPFANSFIQRLDLGTGAIASLAQLPGPSYSVFNLGDGVWLVGESHEPAGNFDPSDGAVHLFGSSDGGRTFTDIFQRPTVDPTGYATVAVHYAYPSRDFPIQVLQPGEGTITARVRSSRPLNTVIPTLKGSPTTSGTLTSTQGTWTGAGPLNSEYQWQRCPVGGLCVDVNGARSSSYAPVPADVGSLLRVRVTTSNSAGSTPAFSAPVGPVKTAASVTSNIAQGQLLTGRVTWNAIVVGAPASTVGSVVFAIDGQSASVDRRAPYVFNGDGGILDTRQLAEGLHRFTVTATFIDGSYATSSVTATVRNGTPPRNVGLPQILDAPVVGRQLSGSAGAWANSPSSFAYQWQRCNTAGTACTDITHATDSRYVVAAADVSSTLRLAVTATNRSGATTAVSRATVPVVPPTCQLGQFLAQYFANRTLTGPVVALRCEWSINRSWQSSSALPDGVPIGNFSARWTTRLYAPAGTYSLSVTAVDGVRIYLDGRLILDKWFDQPSTTYRFSAKISTGFHDIVVEYYSHGSRPSIAFAW